MRVPVAVRAQPHFGVVAVDDADIVESQDSRGGLDQAGQALFRRKVESTDITVAGIEAIANGQVEIRRNQMPDGGELIQFSAKLRAGPGGIFEQNCRLRILFQIRIDLPPGKSQGFGHIQDALFDGQPPVISGMRHQVVSANQESTLQFPAESVNRLIAGLGRRRREIDQVTVVDGEWPEIVLLAQFLETLDLHFVGSLGAPHPRTGRKNLEGIRAEFLSLDRRAFQSPSRGRMYTDTQDSG